MRSVNLIPPEEQRGDRAPMRTGVFTYVLIGGLSVLLLLVVAVALTSKQISDRKSEKADLVKQLADETARAQSVAAFTQFAQVEQNRATTLATLAESRFDWSRVLNEFARVLPPDIWLSRLAGTVSPDVTVGDGDSVSLRTQVAGPALEIIGCSHSQDSVAAFVASLEDIDGVTRVGVDRSAIPDDAGGSSTSASSGSSGSTADDCQTGPDIYKFQIVVAFDAVPPPSVPAASAPPSTGGTQSGQDSQTTDKSQAQQTAEVNSVKTKAHTAVDKLIPGG